MTAALTENPRPIFGTAGLQWGSRAYVRAINNAYPVMNVSDNVHSKGPWTLERRDLKTLVPIVFHGKYNLLDECETDAEHQALLLEDRA